ncbi:MAG: DUF1318 domain-containing protein [Kiritimatiellae bacterium]|nr:DUF1318 domain-containing protein [Kiritimatiellia bacterium]
MNITTTHAALAALAALAAAGCISVKTESEVKPIHITMDVNLKVDRELDRAFADENQAKPKGDFKEIKAMLDRKVAGINSKAMLEARSGATDDDRILIADANSRRTRRFKEVAKDSGVSVEAVQKRYAKRIREKLPDGSGVWIQAENGDWSQK